MSAAVLLASQQAAGAAFQVTSAIGGLYLQKVNRDLQKRQLERQLQKATEVSLRNTEASAEALVRIGEQKMREQLNIQSQKAVAKGAARVRAAQIGGSAVPGLEDIEYAARDASLNLSIQADQAVADVIQQARISVESIKDQLFSMDMSIDPYDIIGPVTQIGSAVFNYQTNMTKMGKNAYGQDINPSGSFWTHKSTSSGSFNYKTASDQVGAYA